MLVVQTDSSIVSLNWFGEFLLSHSRDIIFLPMSAVIFLDEELMKERKEFLLKLAKYYSFKTGMYFEQLLKNLLLYKKKPIKIEFKQKQIIKSDVEIYLDAISHKDVKIILREQNPWITAFFSSQLDKFIVEFDERRLFLNTYEQRAKDRLDRVLKKKDFLFFTIKYTYSKNFLTILFTDPKKEKKKFNYDRKKSFTSENYYQDRTLLHHYGILELSYNASLKEVKSNYRRLAKMYHPDRVHHKNDTIIDLYTKKFQAIQTSYHFLKEHLESLKT
jgi:DnaJ-domain-containing protein 1